MPPVVGLPLSGRDLLALTGAAPDGLPHWLAGRIDERLDRLSGGQRQNVALARALLLDPPILLLDEPTSSMDNTGEERLKQRLQSLLANKTLLLVTHRASMLSLVERLVIVDRGQIIADGPKEVVMDALKRGQISVS